MSSSRAKITRKKFGWIVDGAETYLFSLWRVCRGLAASVLFHCIGLVSYYGNDSHELNIGEKFKKWFQFNDFNQIQQQSLPDLLKTDENIVISAPTGSGKTTLFELAMIRALERDSSKKILYLSPMRALCTEKAQLWSKKFELLGKKCIELIGGDSIHNDSTIEDADMIITTPEKWDYIDEVHTLNYSRGAVLEAVISRMCLALNNPYRIIAVSATIPNIQNIAQWLNAKVLNFSDSMRPVPLKTHVISIPMNGKNGFTFDFSLNYKLPEILTRKSSIKTIEFLSNSSPDRCNDPVELEDKHLKQLIETKSLAYHHAGLSQSDRETVESLFRANKIRVLCSTSTLAIGVNLPAHLVIIKSTLQYTTGSGYTEYSDLDIRQMIGRAGRAGYDSHGIAVILTSAESEQIYRKMSEGKLEIDSQFLPNFIEFLNVEVANGNIKSFSQAMQWLSFTFLFVRMKLNPKKYSLKTDKPFNQQIQNSMDLYLKELGSCGVVNYKDSKDITSTLLGQSMARNFIKLKSLKELQKADFTRIHEISDLLKLLSQNSEILDQIDFKSGDKVLLHKAASDPRLIFPLTGKSNWESWKKPFVFIQIALQSELAEFDSKLTPIQRTDLDTIIDQSFIIDLAAQQGIGLLLRNALELLSSLRGRSWHSNSKLLQQVNGIGQVGSKTLFNSGIRSIDDLKSCEESRLEILLKRNPPFGRNLKRTLSSQFPSCEFDCNLKDDIINISLKSNDSHLKSQVHLLVLAYNSETSCRILYYDQIPISLLPLTRTVNLSTCKERSFSCSLMFEDWAGLNQNVWFDIEKTAKTEEAREQFEVFEEFDISSDFDVHAIEDLERRTKQEEVKVPISPISSKSSLPSNPSKCKHPCKDKLNCAHICCKSGLLQQKKRPASTSQTPDHHGIEAKKPSIFLSGTRRSLANAREYLRKYQPIINNNNTNNSLYTSLLPCPGNDDLYDEIEFFLRSIE